MPYALQIPEIPDLAEVKSGGILVAAHDAREEIKDRANYVCDGVADQVQINAALAANWSVWLSDGTFRYSSPILALTGSRLTGSGYETILTAANGVNDSAIENIDPSGGNSHISISDLRISGNADNNASTNAYGIYLEKCSDCSIERVFITDTHGYCIRLNNAEDVAVRACNLWDSANSGGLVIGTGTRVRLDQLRSYGHVGDGGYGAYLDSTTDVSLLNCFIYANADEQLAAMTSNIRLQIIGGMFNDGTTDGGGAHMQGCSGTLILGASFCNNGGYGLKFERETAETIAVGSNRIIGCAFDGNGTDGLQLYTDSTLVEGCGFHGNTNRGMRCYYKTPNQLNIIGNRFCNNSQSGSYPHIELDNTTNSRFAYNLFLDDQVSKTVTYAIKENATCSGNIVENNTIGTMKTAPLVLQAGTVTRHNSGCATENYGTATVPDDATYIIVSHGLFATPAASGISVTPTNDLGDATKFWVSDIDATSFRINVDADPGADTATFAWQVRAFA